VLEVPAPAAGVLAEIVQADGATVVADQLIAKIDTEAVAGAAARPLPPPRLRPPPPAAAPAAPPLAARPTWPCRPPPSCWPTTSCRLGGRHRQGWPRDQGRRAGRRAGGAKPAAIPPARHQRLPQVAAPVAPPSLGDRPEQRVPMTRLRARVAERLLQSQSTNAILTTFNEVNMAPVMDMRKRSRTSSRRNTASSWAS
jgi:2-oxoglutarate dehydrogenase E2 component (dihydrolipoamide succinyltransferase)